MKRTRRIAVAVVLIAAVGALGVRLYSGWFGKPAAPQVVFAGVRGEQVTMQSLRGKVVLINFWATSCVPCLEEMPRLVSLYERYSQRGFRTVAVAMRYDPPSHVLAYADQARLPFTVALDVDGTVAREFDDVEFVPTTVVVDKRGRIAGRYAGEADFAALPRAIERMLGEPD